MEGTLVDGRFRMDRRIGSGGMGEVWAAQDERMRRTVAVKLVHPLFGVGEDETRARFEREVHLAGRLSHRNIVTVHDWGEVAPVGGRPMLYLVMELVPGVSLSHRLKEPVPPWPCGAGWAVQIASALDTAHHHGVVHRDIKPANVLLTPEGTVKVLDFGVAKFVGDTVNAHHLTVTGAVLGSPPYMSPEQAQGAREIDRRSDLYSLGCLLYHAVTGRPPFVSTGPLAVLRMHLEDEPVAPADLVEDLPGSLNDLVLRLLAKRPEDRPQDATHVHDTLTGILVDQAVTPDGQRIVEAVSSGYADPLAARMLTKAWHLWSRTERQSTERREEADALLAQAASDAERNTRAAKEEAARVLAAAEKEAETVVAVAAAEADRVRAGAAAEAELIGAATRRRTAGRVEQASRQAETVSADRPATTGRLDVRALEGALDLRADTGRLLGAGTGTDRPAGPETLGPAQFDLVRHGYDRRQVDDHIFRLVDEYWQTMSQVSGLESKIHEEIDVLSRGPFSSGAKGLMEHGIQRLDACIRSQAERERAIRVTPADRSGEPPVVFDPAGRGGYDPEPVKDYVTKLRAFRDAARASAQTLGQLLEWLRTHNPAPGSR